MDCKQGCMQIAFHLLEVPNIINERYSAQVSPTKLDFVPNLVEVRNERPRLGRVSLLNQTTTRGLESRTPCLCR